MRVGKNMYPYPTVVPSYRANSLEVSEETYEVRLAIVHDQAENNNDDPAVKMMHTHT